MATITKVWTSIADAAVDPDSPITTALMTALRDNAIHVREWLGASFYAGAVQDHDHDGVNSAAIEVGANLVRNGSFESAEAGWTWTGYTGGSRAISSTVRHHGEDSLAITSTVLANGGGEMVSNAYVPVFGSRSVAWRAALSASVANVSAKVQIIWYDAAKAQISVTDLQVLTNTPTSATTYAGTVAAPASARFARMRVIGGVPASGSAVGTVYFDGLAINDWTGNQSTIEAGGVGQAQLKTTEGSVSTVAPANLTLPGGAYGFFPRTQFAYVAGGPYTVDWRLQNRSVSAAIALAANIYIGATGADDDVSYAYQRYVQASPPYDLGNGDVPVFVFALLERSSGRVRAVYVAEDPPWANNGPTNIAADMTDSSGRKWRWSRPDPAVLVAAFQAGTMSAAQLSEALKAPAELVEVTQALKQQDMPLIPHPFPDANPAIHEVVLLDPVGDAAELLHALHSAGEDVNRLVAERAIVLDNRALDAVTPPGVRAVRWAWRDSQKR